MVVIVDTRQTSAIAHNRYAHAFIDFLSLRCLTPKLSGRGNCGDAKPWQINHRCRGLLQRLVRRRLADPLGHITQILLAQR